jgi:hypothetical protein
MFSARLQHELDVGILREPCHSRQRYRLYSTSSKPRQLPLACYDYLIRRVAPLQVGGRPPSEMILEDRSNPNAQTGSSSLQRALKGRWLWSCAQGMRMFGSAPGSRKSNAAASLL